MPRLSAVFFCGILLCGNAIAAWSQSKTPQAPPTKSAVLSAIDSADQSLKHYQQTLGSYRNLPEVATTIRQDSDPVTVGGMAIILLRTKLSQDETIDPLEIATLFANIDAVAINAALTAGSLLISKSSPPNPKKSEAALAFIEDVQRLRQASDSLWQILESFLRSQKPWHVAAVVSSEAARSALARTVRNCFLFDLFDLADAKRQELSQELVPPNGTESAIPS